MKILFLTNQLDMGGIEKNLLLLTRGLSEQGHDVVVATRGGSLVESVETAGAKHQQLSVSFRPGQFTRDVRVLTRLMRSEAPDIIHVFSAATACLVAATRLRARLSGVRLPPVVGSIMGLQNSPNEGRIRIHLRALLATLGVARLIVVAPAIGRVVNKLPIARRRLIRGNVVGVDVPDVSSLEAGRSKVRQELSVEPHQRLVCTVGRLDRSKSHELFVRAGRVVQEQLPDTRFIIVGDGPERLVIEQELILNGFDQNVLLGERRDVADILAASDVYVRPGVVEGFVGITVLEAQAVQTPVVSFETEDVKLAIEHGKTGVLVRNGDAPALAAAIVRLLQNEELAAAIAAAGRRSVESRFSIDAVTASLTRLYEQEIANRKGVSHRCVE